MADLARGLGRDLNRLKDAAERNALAKDEIIKKQNETISFLKQQRDALSDEQEHHRNLHQNLSVAKEQTIERLKCRIAEMENLVHRQESMMEGLQQNQVLEHTLESRRSPSIRNSPLASTPSSHRKSEYQGDPLRFSFKEEEVKDNFQHFRPSYEPKNGAFSPNGRRVSSPSNANVGRKSNGRDNSRVLNGSYERNVAGENDFSSLDLPRGNEDEWFKLKKNHELELDREKSHSHQLHLDNLELRKTVEDLIQQMKLQSPQRERGNRRERENEFTSESFENEESIDDDSVGAPETLEEYDVDDDYVDQFDDREEEELTPGLLQKYYDLKAKHNILKQKYRRQGKKLLDMEAIVRHVHSQIEQEEDRIQSATVEYSKLLNNLSPRNGKSPSNQKTRQNGNKSTERPLQYSPNEVQRTRDNIKRK